MYFVFKPCSQSVHALLPNKERKQASFYRVKFSFSYAKVIKKCIALIFVLVASEKGTDVEMAP